MTSEQQYLELLLKVKNEGTDRGDRTGTGTRSIFGHQLRFDLQEGFPLLTTKKVFTKGIIHELLWFLSGDTNIKYLVDNNVHIWDDWPHESYLKAQKNNKGLPELSKDEFIKKIKEDNEFAKKWGEIGPAYGYQWRNFNGEGVDQIQKVIDTINNKPESRRILVVAYNPSQADDMLLPPCHSLFQFYVADGKLSCQMYQRSADLFIGVPFNIASYSILTHMIAHVTNLEVGDFIHTFGDTHIYHNHFDQVSEQLSRTPNSLPTLKINRNVPDIFSFKFEDFEIEGYDPHPAIKAPIAV